MEPRIVGVGLWIYSTPRVDYKERQDTAIGYQYLELSRFSYPMRAIKYLVRREIGKQKRSSTTCGSQRFFPYEKPKRL